jgi:site-specific DNA-cytosine methylase
MIQNPLYLIKKVVDFYSGAGCFSEGFRQAGFDIVMGVDNWQVAVDSYNANFGKAMQADVTQLNIDDLPDADVFIGSPPCQEWSRGKGNKRTFDMTYIDAFWKIVQAKKPKYYIWECAPETAKINCDGAVLDAQEYGVPQHRKRAFHANFDLPSAQEVGKSVNEVFNWTETKVLFNHRSLNENAFSPVYLSNRPARTVVTWPIRIYKEGTFTVDMMKQIQTIPSNFFLCGSKEDQFKQIGNAVPPRLAYHIAKWLLKYDKEIT